MEKQFQDDLQRQPLAHQIVHINPQKLHQQHEDHDEKREDEAAEEGFQYELVKLFHNSGINAKIKKILTFGRFLHY